MKILIVGAGVAGSTLVGCLKKRGITNITLIEKAPAFHHIGFLIGLWGNGRFVMRYIGIDGITERQGREVRDDIVKDKKGKILKILHFGSLKQFGSTVTISRADLHEGLQTLLAGVDMRFNTTVASIGQEDRYVDVLLSDGAQERFDLVVGADGVHSSVREQIFGAGFVEYYGWGAWAYWLPDSFKYPPQPTGLLGEGKACFILPSHHSSTVTFIAPVTHCAGFQSGDRRAKLRELFSNFGSFAIDTLRVAPDSNNIWYDDIAHVSVPLWYKSRVALVGDAQHAVSPVVGMGSSMAMEDAYVLADELARNQNNIDLALSGYAKRRERRMRIFLSEVDRVNAWMLASGALGILRDRLLPFVPSSYFTAALNRLLEEKI